MFLFSCRHVPANTVLSFSNCILPQTGTMIQLFLYIFKSNACETHPRKAFISNHILYICYICTKKEADKFIHHLLLSWSIEFLRLCLFIYWPDFPYKSVCILCLFPYSEIFMTAVVFNRWQIYAMLLLTVSQDDVCLRTDYYKVINL